VKIYNEFFLRFDEICIELGIDLSTVQDVIDLCVFHRNHASLKNSWYGLMLKAIHDKLKNPPS
jgi:hypothetical protein